MKRAKEPQLDSVRALDHYIVQVRELDAAGTAYERLGFHVLPRMKHIELGTSNRIVQFENTYLELIADLDKGPREMAVKYLPRFECGDGLSHVALRSFDLAADHKAARELGLEPYDIINARRQVVFPDSSVDDTDSYSMYMWRNSRLYLSLFLSEHRKPDTIWIPEYQQHANTAKETIGITFVSDDPQLDRDYFSKIYGVAPVINRLDEVRFVGSRGDMAEIYSRDAIHRRYEALDVKVCDKLAGYPFGVTIRVQSLSLCRETLKNNGVDFTADRNSLYVGPSESHGVVIEFTRH